MAVYLPQRLDRAARAAAQAAAAAAALRVHGQNLRVPVYTEDGVCDDGGDGAALCRYRKATHKRLGQSGGEQASAAPGEAWAGTLLRPACLSGQSAWPF